MITKPSACICNNYNEIVEICKTTHEPVLLMKDGKGELVVMDLETYNKREASLDLYETLKEVEERRKEGVEDVPADEVSSRMRTAIAEIDHL